MSVCYQERSGYCETCRTIYSWRGGPQLREAVCPTDGCGKALRRAAHKRGERKAQTPNFKGAPALSLRAVCP